MSRSPAEIGYPWPWQVPELVEEYAVDADVDLRELAADWGCSTELLKRWVRRHGYAVDNHEAVTTR